MSDSVRYGVIGTGMMGCEHLRNIEALPGTTTVAVSDPVDTSRRWAAKAVDDRPIDMYTDHRDLLRRDDLEELARAGQGQEDRGPFVERTVLKRPGT